MQFHAKAKIKSIVVVKVGAVDGTAAEAVMQKYQVQGFPTIKIFGADKKSPQDYNGERTAAAMVSESMKAVTRMIKDRAKNPSGSSSSGSKSSSNSKPSGGGKKSGGSDVVTLTEVNFNALVMESQEEWLVEFYAPW
jgi:protein disulfide-isomerase A6